MNLIDTVINILKRKEAKGYVVKDLLDDLKKLKHEEEKRQKEK